VKKINEWSNGHGMEEEITKWQWGENNNNEEDVIGK